MIVFYLVLHDVFISIPKSLLKDVSDYVQEHLKTEPTSD
jgi:hypothetical protein